MKRLGNHGSDPRQPGLVAGQCRHHDNGNIRLGRGCEFLMISGQEFITIHDRHAQIQQHQLNVLVPTQLLQSLCAMGGFKDLKILKLQEKREAFADAGVVFDDEDPGRVHVRGAV